MNSALLQISCKILELIILKLKKENLSNKRRLLYYFMSKIVCGDNDFEL